MKILENAIRNARKQQNEEWFEERKRTIDNKKLCVAADNEKYVVEIYGQAIKIC